jgi:hypothetical protein
MAIWYIFPVSAYCTIKNLATLIGDDILAALGEFEP